MVGTLNQSWLSRSIIPLLTLRGSGGFFELDRHAIASLSLLLEYHALGYASAELRSPFGGNSVEQCE